MGIKVRVEEKIDGNDGLAKKLALRRERLRQEREEEKEGEIENSLAEIYQDNEGGKIDVNRMKIRRKQGLIFWFFNILVFSLVAIVLGFGAYYYIIYGKGTDSAAVSVDIAAADAVSAGEEFTYVISYKNQEYVALKSANLKVDYPENFIFLSASPEPKEGNYSWDLGRINSRSEGIVKIKGKIIDKAGAASVLLARLTYTPENFNSEFKKENSDRITVKDVGFTVSFDFSNTALVGEQENIALIFKALNANYLPEFRIRMEKDDNVKLGDTIVNRGAPAAENGNSLKADKLTIEDKKDAWDVSGLQKKEEMLEIKYRIKEKKGDEQKIKFYFEEKVGGKYYVFLEKELSIEVMKSDLNLNLILNGTRNNQPIDFGQKLNYSIVYSNKGEASMKDVVIMAVLDSDFLDWTTLDDKNNGREMGDTITWTKNEIPGLEKIDVGGQGTIDFIINVLPFKESDLGKNFIVTSYSQYAIGGLEKFGQASSTSASSSDNFDNRSNTIESIINSDLSFREQVRYFDENNLPVGNGPLPPAVGERTSFKVYWDLKNNLHDLSDAQVQTVLPVGVDWDGHNRTSVGTLSYDQPSRTITWIIGRLPITVYRADAEFNIGITPGEDSRNKIVVLLNGSKINALDAKTGALLEKKSIAKTTKLDDDEIANMSSDGRVK